MMNIPYARYALSRKALEFVPPLIRDTLLENSSFRERYGFRKELILSFPDSDISFRRSSLYDTARKVLSGASEKKVIDKKGSKVDTKDHRQ